MFTFCWCNSILKEGHNFPEHLNKTRIIITLHYIALQLLNELHLGQWSLLSLDLLLRVCKVTNFLYWQLDSQTVTVIPPTQEVAVLGSRKNTVRVRNYSSKSQLALLYSTSHKVTQHLIVSRTYTVNIRHQQTLTLSGSLSLSIWLTDSVFRYI